MDTRERSGLGQAQPTLETGRQILLLQPESRPGLASPPTPSPREAASPKTRSLLGRLVLVLVGFGIAMLGWSLIMTVFLVFIGLPLFIVGLAIMQTQES